MLLALAVRTSKLAFGMNAANLLLRFLDSTVGQKAVAAATGAALLGFVVMHMLGNLLIFAGQEALNSYALKLQSMGPLLWVARIGLLALIVLHMAMTIRLRFRNRAARGDRYAVRQHKASTLSSRTMLVSGSIILVFVVFHLLHLSFGVIQPDAYHLVDAAGRHDVYSMVIAGFQNWGIAAIYIVAMLVLCAHLTHATFSLFQSLGANIGGKDTRLKRVAQVVAAGIVLGYVVIPVAVLAGWFGN